METQKKTLSLKKKEVNPEVVEAPPEEVAEVETETAEDPATELRITKNQAKSVIEKKLFHRFEGTNVMVCCLVIRNGFTVIGSAGCLSDDTFDEKSLKARAKRDAFSKIHPLEGYLKLHESSQSEDS